MLGYARLGKDELTVSLIYWFLSQKKHRISTMLKYLFNYFYLTHLLFKLEHAIVAVADKIFGCIRHGVFFVEKFRNMKAADVDIEMNISQIIHLPNHAMCCRKFDKPSNRSLVQLREKDKNLYSAYSNPSTTILSVRSLFRSQRKPIFSKVLYRSPFLYIPA